MSDLVYQNYNNKCRGWINPSNISFGPQISSLSGYQSPAGSTTVVSINGSNFYSYSVIRFGTFTPTIYFINSNLLEFYIPNTLSSGTFPIQVCNGSVCSNTINYTIDNASGYWLLQGQNITNSNGNSIGGVNVSWLSKGAPVKILYSIYTFSNPYIVPPNVNWIICDVTSGDIYLTFPSSTEYIGREITIKRIGSNTVYSSTPNIQSFDITTTGNTIIDNTPSYNYSWVTLVYNGTIWITMQAA